MVVYIEGTRGSQMTTLSTADFSLSSSSSELEDSSSELLSSELPELSCVTIEEAS